MANRRFEMFHYRQIIHRMRMGESDRAIAKTKTYRPINALRSTIARKGLFDRCLFRMTPSCGSLERTHSNPRASPSAGLTTAIRQWTEKGFAEHIHEALVNQFGFTGSYSRYGGWPETEKAEPRPPVF